MTYNNVDNNLNCKNKKRFQNKKPFVPLEESKFVLTTEFSCENEESKISFEKINEKVAFIAINSLDSIISQSYNYDMIPPFIGVLITNLEGYPILMVEYKPSLDHKYKTIKEYINENNEEPFEMFLFTGFISALRTYTDKINFQKGTHNAIYGKTMKVHIFHNFEDFNVVLFLNSKTEFYSILEKEIINHFKGIITKYKNHFTDSKYFSHPKNKIKTSLETHGQIWLNNLNKKYIQKFKKGYSELRGILDGVIGKLKPAIQKILGYYFDRIPTDDLNDLSREIKKEVDDIIADSKLFKP